MAIIGCKRTLREFSPIFRLEEYLFSILNLLAIIMFSIGQKSRSKMTLHETLNLVQMDTEYLINGKINILNAMTSNKIFGDKYNAEIANCMCS